MALEKSECTALCRRALLTVIVRTIPSKIFSDPNTVSIVSNMPSLSSCISLLYVNGVPFKTVNSPIKFPYARPVFPRISSAISGFFFCGIIDDPVENASSSSINLNSSVDQIMISSAKRDKCVINSAEFDKNSTIKSRSLTASIELAYTSAKPSSSADFKRSIGNVVPAIAPAPKGKISMRFIDSVKRSLSRCSCQKYTIKWWAKLIGCARCKCV